MLMHYCLQAFTQLQAASCMYTSCMQCMQLEGACNLRALHASCMHSIQVACKCTHLACNVHQHPRLASHIALLAVACDWMQLATSLQPTAKLYKTVYNTPWCLQATCMDTRGTFVQLHTRNLVRSCKLPPCMNVREIACKHA